MKFCTACGHPLEDGPFCTSCGTPAAVPDAASAPTTALPTPGGDLTKARPVPSTATWVPAAATTGGTPYPPPPPPAPWTGRGLADPAGPGNGGRGVGVPLLVALTALLLVVAAGALYLQSNDHSDATPASPVASATVAPPPAPVTPTGAPNASAQTSPPNSSSSSSSSSSVTPPSNTGANSPPTSTPFRVVVVASKTDAEGGQAAAEALVPSIRNAGYPAMVFRSQNYGSLRCCYWVVAAGPFSSAAVAKAASSDLRSRSSVFGIAYDRCVGASYECP